MTTVRHARKVDQSTIWFFALLQKSPIQLNNNIDVNEPPPDWAPRPKGDRDSLVEDLALFTALGSVMRAPSGEEINLTTF